MSRYYVPQHKWQLITSLHLLLPAVPISKWRGMEKKQLYAIYHRLREMKEEVWKCTMKDVVS